MSILKSLKAAEDVDDLAVLLGYKPKSLTYILYKLPDAAKYTTFKIPKKTGGEREICAPTDQLRLLQRRLANILYTCRDEIDHESGKGSLSHGFRRGHSIVTNAKPHHRRRFVLNLDLKDFFPSFNFGRVRGFFIKSKAFELNEKVATLIAQIACHQNALPQGSPCSPIISDLLAHLLDTRLAKMAKKEGVTYSRYADDLTFSTNKRVFPTALAIQNGDNAKLWELGEELTSRIADTGFTINPDKTRMQCRMSRQLVTSLTVNAKVNVRMEYYKRTRAMCDTLFKTGLYSDIPFNKSLARRRDNALAVAGSEKDKDGVKAAKTSITSLGPLSGRLAHIHHVKDRIDTREEWEKRKHKTTFRMLYCRFLFYRNFAALDKPLILTEGKTDNVYLSLAVKNSPKFHPKLGQLTAKGFQSNLRYFNHLNETHKIMELDGGSGNFKFFIIRYKEIMDSFKHKPMLHPVVLVVDNDGGAKDIFATIKTNYGISINHDGKHGFYHVTHNLYLVKTPHVGKKQQTCIEDMFEPALLKEELGGKKLNLGKLDPAKEYGKHLFAEKVVRPKASTLKWDGFEPLLQRVVEVLDHYKPPT
ncbi:Retron-type reverse transcriptase [Hartmannibacter diazotrophicus]|uniref:RNA-directed DNA polymerase n=1 Tax=Hartmannibacter diazotrophicus TaxID=1482074 RepID=A0A2C9DAP3_9HYPH|nr:retron Ec67 family RNA-directed DNA polymerase/endonuclease [Hartmannibacter diazotrophicus]SON57394.1 Retron-type reverse transcriptase [Hartmannibacter diazotrophicus]